MAPTDRDSEKLKFWELISDDRLHKKYSEAEVGVSEPVRPSPLRGLLPLPSPHSCVIFRP